MQDVCSTLHDFDVPLGGVCTLSIGDWIDKTIHELFPGTKKIWLHKVYHAVICVKESIQKINDLLNGKYLKTGSLNLSILLIKDLSSYGL